MTEAPMAPKGNLLPKLSLLRVVFFVAFGVVAVTTRAQSTANAATLQKPHDFPAAALMIEARVLDERPDRALLLWMPHPEKHPDGYSADDIYTCPDYTRGSYYSGKTRVSLVDVKAGRIINTVEIKQEYGDGDDSFDVPYAIRKGYHYRVEGDSAKGEEVKPSLLWLKDYNGDGKALEFVLFDAEACMGLATTLIGYSVRQDKVIQYPIQLKSTAEGKTKVETSHWCDYLFDKEPTRPGYWDYEVDYRGRAGSLDAYNVRYNPKEESFEGTCTSTTE